MCDNTTIKTDKGFKMKLKNIVLSLALIGAMNVVMADDVTTSPTTTNTTSIDAEIAKIQEAPAAERVELMNQFKQKLMQMNEAERMAAITAMQERMHGNANSAVDGAQTHAHEAHAQMQEHVQEMQMQTTQHMNQAQHMTQHQAGDQFMHMPGHDQATAIPMHDGVDTSSMQIPVNH